MIWLKLCNVLRKLLKFSLNTALRNTREIASQFSLSVLVLWTHVFSLLAHREFLYFPSTPRGSVGPIFPRDEPFSVTVWLSLIFARLIFLKTLCSSVVSMKTSAARRPEAFLTNCHAYSTLPLNFSHSALHSFHFGFWLDCSPIWWCIQARFLPNSQEDGVVQLPFRPALRLRLFSNELRARSFLSSLSSNPFLLAFRWNLRLLDSLIL